MPSSVSIMRSYTLGPDSLDSLTLATGQSEVFSFEDAIFKFPNIPFSNDQLVNVARIQSDLSEISTIKRTALGGSIRLCTIPAQVVSLNEITQLFFPKVKGVLLSDVFSELQIFRHSYTSHEIMSAVKAYGKILDKRLQRLGYDGVRDNKEESNRFNARAWNNFMILPDKDGVPYESLEHVKISLKNSETVTICHIDPLDLYSLSRRFSDSWVSRLCVFLGKI